MLKDRDYRRMFDGDVKNEMKVLGMMRMRDEQCINENVSRSSKHSPCSSMVEQWPPKPKVVGSNPVTDAFLT